jgi:phage host-nuclease inhibitor protein Gam
MNALMNAEAIEIPEVESEGFVVDSDQKAEWALRKIREHRADASRMAMVCDAEIDRYGRIRKEAADKCARDCAYLESLLYAYFVNVPHKATKTQESYKLPTGVLKQKIREPEYVRADAEILAWLNEQGMKDYVEVKPSLKWAELKKVITANGETAIYPETGEIIPGVKVVEREPVFTVEV